MQRRTNAISGWVNFPVDDIAWKNSNEGGMLVKLVVCDNREFGNNFAMCCGAAVFDTLSESLVGDDRRPKPKVLAQYESIEALAQEQRDHDAWLAYHFPSLSDEAANSAVRYASRDYLSVTVLGTTGWSGWHTADEVYWECRFENLTDEGKALYRQLEQLYPGCDLHLLTFLDT